MVIKTKIDKNNPTQKIVHVYKNKVDKLPIKGTTFSINTKLSTILEWAHSENIATFIP